MLTQTAESVPRFIVTLSAAQAEAAALVRVPLAITGKWVRGKTEFAITREDLESIARNFRERQNGEINVDYDHASEMPEVAAGGPVPSAGRIVRLDSPEALGAQALTRPASSGPPFPSGRGAGGEGAQSRVPSRESRLILYGWYEPTERARALLKNREYRFISPAIEWGSRSKRTGKTQGTTLTSVALTNRPFLEELPQIRLSDPAFQPVDDTPGWRRHGAVGHVCEQPDRTHGESRRVCATHEGGKGLRPIPLPKGEGARHGGRVRGTAPISNFQFPVSNTGGLMKFVTPSVADGKIRITHADFAEDFFLDPEELRRCLEQLGLAAPAALMSESAANPITLAEARALLSENTAQGKFIPAAEFFRAQVDQEIDDAMKSGKILPRHRDDWRKIALADLPSFRRVLAAQKVIVPLKPVGFSGSGPADVRSQVKLLAEQRMRDRGLTYGQALSDLGREQPELVEQYRRAVSGNE